MNVKYTRPEVAALKPIWEVIRAVIAGPAAIKLGGTKFLPMPNPEDDSPENKARYESYLTRARFYGATARTHKGYIGQIFYRDPVIELPALLQPLMDSVDGGELTLVQQAKQACSEDLALGHGGLLTDYPEVVLPEGQKSVTLADQQSGKVRPTIILYKAEQIINWRWALVGSTRVLSMLVLEEQYDAEDDGFEVKTSTQWRVFRMENKVLHAYIYREGKNGYELNKDYYPKKGNGKPWDQIPFSWYGADNNDPLPDKPPLEDMAHLNVGHYRNSADYEEACFMLGQPTPWASGLTEDWVSDVMKGTIYLGSRAVVPLPQGGAMGLLQMDPNTMPFEAMKLKEAQMVTLGAKLAEAIEVQRTATETNADTIVENSVLSNVAQNVSAAYMKALGFAAEYSGDSGKITFELNTDFEVSRLTAQERQQLLAEWQGNAITWEEYRWNIKRAGVAFQDDDVAKEQIQSDMKENFDLSQEMIPAGDPTSEKDPPQDS